MKYFTLIISILLFSTALSIPTMKKKKWTIFWYMNGDNDWEVGVTGGWVDLSEEGLNKKRMGRLGTRMNMQGCNNSDTNCTYIPGDFHHELANMGSSEYINVVALVDRVPGYSDTMDNWTETRLYYVNKDDWPDNTRSTYWVNVTGYNELNMGDPNTMVSLMKIIKEHFPAENYCMIPQDHNWGWHDGYFEEDYTNNHDTISYGQLSDVLFENKNDIPHLSVIGYDACVSAHVEVLHTWRPYVDAYAGSQDYVGWGGIDGGIVIRALYDNPFITPNVLSSVIASSMMLDPESGCATGFMLNESFDNMVKEIDTLAQLFLEYLDNIRLRLIGVRGKTPQVPELSEDDYFHKDLRTMAEFVAKEFSEEPTYPDIVKTAENLIKAFDDSLTYNDYREHLLTCNKGQGLSVYWTKSGEKPSPDYYNTSFAQDTHWDEFLDKF